MGIPVWKQGKANGRVTGLTCPMCSEPLGDIDHRPPYLRVRCARCGEGFEGRVE